MNKLMIFLLILLLQFGINLSAETVKVFGVNGQVQILEFDSDITEIHFSKIMPQIQDIEGLSQFVNLNKLHISFSDLRQMEFSFLKEIRNLQVFELSFTKISNLDFIKNLPMLIAFSSNETMLIENFSELDLSNNKHIEFIEIHGAKLINLPKLHNVPESLKYVSFYGTEIENIELDTLCSWVCNDASYIFSDNVREHISTNYFQLTFSDKSILRQLYEQYNL